MAVSVPDWPLLLLCAAVGKALIHLAMVNPVPTSSKAAVERDVLAAAGGHLTSIDNHAFAYHTRNVFFKGSAAFARCLLPLRQALCVIARVFCLPRLRQLSALQTSCLAFVGFAVDPLVQLLLSLKSLNTKDAHSTLRGVSRYKHSLAHIPLVPSVDHTEEALEHWVGQRKGYLAKRGAHNHKDIIREAMADERAAQARADYGLPDRRKPQEVAAPAQCYTRGIVICGNALNNELVRSAFAAARRRVPEPLRSAFVELPSQWMITACPAADLDTMTWPQLRDAHDVLCLCDSPCEHG